MIKWKTFGGVPRRIVFDNAGGVGHRVRDKIKNDE